MNELYYKINYYHNRFFILNNDYYIYLVNIINNNYIYQFELRHDKILYLKIINKNKYLFETFYIKIIHKNKEYNLIIKDNNLDSLKIGNIFKFNYSNEFIIKNNDVFFDINYYKYNNKLLNNNYLDNIEYINYHWYLCGRVNPYLYFKYLLKKYEDMIFKLEIPKFDMNSKENENTMNLSKRSGDKELFSGTIVEENTMNLSKRSGDKELFSGTIVEENTLLFIDSRYDPSFIYLARLFLYSVDETWNITIFTKESNKKDYENDLNKLGIIGNINIIENDLNNNIEYSNLLKDINFWKNIKEDNCLLFQYDSFCMKKFDPIFFNYNYIGARWPHKASKYEKINIGNGGTSFRKTRIMEEMIINNGNSKKNLIEDIFFAELLYENNLYNCSEEIADKFSFENIFNNNSCYAHQIYNSIKLEDLDTFIYEKLKNMLDNKS